MKEKFFLKCILIFALIVFCAYQSVNAEELLGGDCGNGIDWEYNSGTFTLQNLKAFSEILDNNDTIMYTIGAYSKDERLLNCSTAYENNSDSVSLLCDIDDLIDYRLKFFFWKNGMMPVSSKATFDILCVEPTCTSNGYTSVYNKENDKKEIFNISKALGHDYGDYEILKEANVTACGYRKRICRRCGNVEETPCYSDMEMARLCMYGDLTGIGKKAEVPITVSFAGEGNLFDCYAYLKYQGHTSLIYDKKNFTLKLYKDEMRSKKNKIVFRNWKKEHKYILKANYIDPSACRNLICADIWSEMVMCRDGHNEMLDSCSHFGATDGFPIALYLNDNFFGLYTMTLHRDDDLFNMDEGVYDAIVVTNTNYRDESRFKEQATFSEESDWEVEYNGMEDDSWAKNKVNDLINFVMTSSDEEFRNNLNRYLDVNSAIDYLIAIYGLGITENASKNITLACYSGGTWIMSLCDMEAAFGLTSDGTGHYQANLFLPICNGGKWNSNTNSLLWDRLLDNFEPEIRARYSELRSSVLVPEEIIGKVRTFINSVPAEFYSADMNLYPDMPQLDIAASEQIEEYIISRLNLLDEIFINQ